MMDPELAKTIRRSEEMGEAVAALVRVPPRRVKYIKARGILCHELLSLLGGSIEFRRATSRQRVIWALESVFRIMPVDRWYAPQDCTLELVGQHSEYETRAYRLRRDRNPQAVFFVLYKPSERDGHNPAFSNTPMLDYDRFLRPPFDHSNDSSALLQLLRRRTYVHVLPSLLSPEAEQFATDCRLAICRGLWKGLNDDLSSAC